MKPVTVTYLETRSEADIQPREPSDPRFHVAETVLHQWELNRFLYLLVGKNWSWTDKRDWSEQQWRSYVESGGLRTFVAYVGGSVAGYYETRPDFTGGIEIAIFGLAPQFVGKGLGGALLTSALREAWRSKPTRVWLHTCSLDHPAALANYQARGMKIYRVEQVQVK